MSRGKRPQASCHPDRPHEAKGLCHSCYKKKLYKDLPEDVKDAIRKEKREKHATWRLAHPIVPKEKKTSYYTRNKEKLKLKARIRNLAYYGLTLEDYNNMLEDQDGVCAICERPPKTLALNVDHEHQKKEKNKTPESRRLRVRGLICHRCNRALGLFGNDLELLLLASKNFAEYIERYYAKRLVDDVGIEEAKRLMGNTVKYLENYEKRVAGIYNSG